MAAARPLEAISFQRTVVESHSTKSSFKTVVIAKAHASSVVAIRTFVSLFFQETSCKNNEIPILCPSNSLGELFGLA